MVQLADFLGCVRVSRCGTGSVEDSVDNRGADIGDLPNGFTAPLFMVTRRRPSLLGRGRAAVSGRTGLTATLPVGN